MNDLVRLSELLDEHIEKGEKIARRHRFQKSTKTEIFEEQIIKSLSHDPFAPVEMNEDSPYYNPYTSHPMGGFMPHSNESWQAQGRDRDAGTHEFYRVAGDEPMDAFMYKKPDAPSTSVFAQLRRSVDTLVWGEDLAKGGPVAVGTIHTYTDGQKYKKISEGKWAPVAGVDAKKTTSAMQHKDPKVQAQAHQGIEVHAQQKSKIEGLIKQRQREQVVIGEAKNQAVQAAAGHTKNMMSRMYDGKVPKHIDEEHKKIMTEHGADVDPKATLEKEGKGLQPKVHHVSVGFKHNGKDYSHKFENVEGGGHQDAIDRVQEILKQKLPGHQLTSIRAETPKPPKESIKEAPKKSPSGEARA